MEAWELALQNSNSLSYWGGGENKFSFILSTGCSGDILVKPKESCLKNSTEVCVCGVGGQDTREGEKWEKKDKKIKKSIQEL